jgi:hypothetical protein
VTCPIIRYEATDGSFTANITVDTDAVVNRLPRHRAATLRKLAFVSRLRVLGTARVRAVDRSTSTKAR